MNLSLKARIGQDSKDRRFVDEDEGRLPDEVADPRVIRDDSQPTLWEKIRSVRWWLLTFLAAITVFLLYLIAIGAAIAPDILGNVVVQLIVSHLAVFAIGYYLATRSTLRRVRDVDWLTLVKPSGLEFYPGDFVPSGDDERYHHFVPYRGFTWKGHVKNPLTIGDVNPALARKANQANRDPDDPAVIRLDPDFGERTSTEWGDVLAQISNGLDIDTFGSNAVLAATLPPMADESRMDDLRQQIESERENVKHYEGLAEMYRSQRDDVIEKAREPTIEQVEELIEIHERIAIANRPSRSKSDEGGEILPADQELERVAQEVSNGE